MDIWAITAKAMQETPAKEFGDIARMRYGISRSIDEKKRYVVSNAGEEMCKDMPDAFFEHTYRAMHDYGMSVYDADKWAWLNTLFGYDIGAERALDLIRWYDDNGMDVLELNADDKEFLQNVAEVELGFHFNFVAFPDETPNVICYIWPDHI